MTLVFVIAGHLGTVPLAGAGLGAETFHAFFLLGLGLAIAVSPLIAEAQGRGQTAAIPAILRQGILATGLSSLPCMLLLWFIEPILLALGQAPDVSAAAREFTRPAALGLPGWLWFYVLRNALAAIDRPRPGLWVVLAALLVQMALGYGLTFGCLGWAGWGLAGTGLSFALVGWFMAVALYAVKPWALGWRPEFVELRRIVRLGLPVSLALFFEISLFLVSFYLQGLISAASQAAHAVAVQIAAIPFMALVGLGQATTVRLGLALGRQDIASARAAVLVSVAAGLVCIAISATAFLGAPRPLMLLFLDPSQPDVGQVLALGTSFLAVVALFQLGDGGQVLGMACLRGLQDTRVPMILAAIGYWAVGLPMAALLGFATPLAGLGIWLGIASGLGVTTLLLFLRLGSRLHGRAWNRSAE